jgi:hypothetical protein
VVRRGEGIAPEPGDVLSAGWLGRRLAQQPDQVDLTAYAQFGVDGRQVVADGARAHEEFGRDGLDALTVEQAGEYC